MKPYPNTCFPSMMRICAIFLLNSSSCEVGNKSSTASGNGLDTSFKGILTTYLDEH